MLKLPNLAKPIEFSAEPDMRTDVLSFPLGVYSFLKRSKHEGGSRAISISNKRHQNANQQPIGSAPAYQAQCTLPPCPIYQTLLFNFSRVWFQEYMVAYPGLVRAGTM